GAAAPARRWARARSGGGGAKAGAPRRHLAGELEGGDQAGRVGAAGAGDVEGGAVIGRGADEGEAERDVDAAVEIDRLDRDERLVVIHAEHGVVALARRRMEQRVGGKGADRL